MASVRDIRRHIRSVTNIKKITKTMQMVAGARMHKTSSALMASRPYAKLAWSMLLDLSAKTEREVHPLLQTRVSVKKKLVLLITSDRGLCGALNMNLIHEALKFVTNKDDFSFLCIGKKGRDFLTRRGYRIIAEFSGLSAPVSFLQVGPVSQIIIKDFIDKVVDEVHIVFGDYVSNVVQKPVAMKLLPLQQKEKTDLESFGEFIYEPNAREVIASLIPRIIEYQIYAAILETQASEFAARMMAMKNATENAENLISSLVLSYNKARQEGITKELAELSTSKVVIEEQ